MSTLVAPHVAATPGAVAVTAIAMDTLVTVEVVAAHDDPLARAAADRALRWFRVVEQACSRFDPESELRQLQVHVGVPVEAGPVLFQALRFAQALARRTRGAFDPTIGHALEAAGFDRHYVTGTRTPRGADGAGQATYRDVLLDERRVSVTLRRPVSLDLGAVAKGLAIDLAAQELAGFESICIEAGGDLLACGQHPDGRPWRIGVRDPHSIAGDPRPLCVLEAGGAGGQAVCTSGGYERRTEDGAGHHLIDPRTRASASSLASVTVIAPAAMAADGLATAAFIMGPARGRRLLEAEGVQGVLVTPDGAITCFGDLRVHRPEEVLL